MKLLILSLWLVLSGLAVTTTSAQSGQDPAGGSSDRSGQENSQRRRRGAEAGAVPKLLRHRADLGLTDDQVRQLQEIDRTMQDRNRPYVEQLLRIRHEMQVRPGVEPRDMTESERKEFQSHVEQARPLWEQISKNNHAAMREVGDVLNAEQKAQLREMLRKPREKNGSPGPERSQSGRG